jgi:SAM-dependent methyltransferase
MSIAEGAPGPPPLAFREAARSLLDEFAWNPWFVTTFWPENESRISLMARLACRELPDGKARRTLDVGCSSGFLAFLFAQLGFDVVAVDAYDDGARADLFRKRGIVYQPTNLNDPVPLSEFPSGAFHLVLLGEVFEHILNRPVGLLEAIHRVLAPGGVLILTTPNPSSLANAIRLIQDRYVLWGTAEFLRQTKLEGREVIDRGDIHYREYPAWLVRDLLTEIGFDIGGTRYLPMGNAATQSLVKRCLKRVLRVTGLSRTRLLSPDYLIWARRPA